MFAFSKHSAVTWNERGSCFLFPLAMRLITSMALSFCFWVISHLGDSDRHLQHIRMTSMRKENAFFLLDVKWKWNWISHARILWYVEYLWAVLNSMVFVAVSDCVLTWASLGWWHGLIFFFFLIIIIFFFSIDKKVVPTQTQGIGTCWHPLAVAASRCWSWF